MTKLTNTPTPTDDAFYYEVIGRVSNAMFSYFEDLSPAFGAPGGLKDFDIADSLDWYYLLTTLANAGELKYPVNPSDPQVFMAQSDALNYPQPWRIVSSNISEIKGYKDPARCWKVKASNNRETARGLTHGEASALVNMVHDPLNWHH